MTAMLLTGGWFALAAVVSLVVGRVIRHRDERETPTWIVVEEEVTDEYVA